MKRLTRLITTIFALTLILQQVFFNFARPVQAGVTSSMAASLGLAITGFQADPNNIEKDCGPLASNAPMNLDKYFNTTCDDNGQIEGVLPVAGNYMALLYQNQPSSREYIANILDNIGIPQISSAYAQGTGYRAMSPFLEFWKVFRNLAYSLYIIMFVVVGIMIMLRTKINAQTIVTIQSALPNLIITLLLITFSYAIVGFMIDLMYFLIYAIVYLVSSSGVISTPTKVISRLMSYSSWSIVFEGRNSILSAMTLAVKQILSGISALSMKTRIGVGLATGGLSEILVNGILYLFVAVWMVISMGKLLFVLFKSYLMIIVQTITAPIQLLMNALPGSQAFSGWLKKTASYLIPFPVAAAMFIIAAIFIGNPTKATILNRLDWRDANPFGINQDHDFYKQWDSNKIWLPPFTFTGTNNWNSQDIMVIMGFLIFTMTPAVTKMAQEWLQVKESPYISEALFGAGATYKLGTSIYNWKMSRQRLELEKQQAKYYKKAADNLG